MVLTWTQFAVLKECSNSSSVSYSNSISNFTKIFFQQQKKLSRTRSISTGPTPKVNCHIPNRIASNISLAETMQLEKVSPLVVTLIDTWRYWCMSETPGLLSDELIKEESQSPALNFSLTPSLSPRNSLRVFDEPSPPFASSSRMMLENLPLKASTLKRKLIDDQTDEPGPSRSQGPFSSPPRLSRTSLLKSDS